MSFDFKLKENVFIETDTQSDEYDGVILVLYPDELNVNRPNHLSSFIDGVSKIDKYIHKSATLWNCEYVSGGRLILAPTGKITPYHDARVIKDAAKKGMVRALDAGVKKPLVIVQNVNEYPEAQLVAVLGSLEALYLPLQLRERDNTKNFIRVGFYAEENGADGFEKKIRNAIALEKARIVTRDIAGGDPERMTPANVVAYVKSSFQGDNNVKISVVDNEKIISEQYPLLAAVSRAASRVERHKPRILELEYTPTDRSRITETILLVGKGVTFDSGGADIKVSGQLIGMSRDKSGAAAVAGFIKACSILKPPHLKVIGVMCLCRNSVGEDCYVPDEIVISRSGKAVRVTNTDTEGRFAMADSIFRVSQIAAAELNPHIYTIATLTLHAVNCYGANTAAVDNYSARASNHATKLQLSGSRIADGIEVSVLRPEDFAVNLGKGKGDDLVQIDVDAKNRCHQFAAGFLALVGGLEDKNIKYTHLDIAGSAGLTMAEDPTAAPVLALCHLHKVLM